MTAFSLVHGGQQGAWVFEPLIDALSARGHTAVAIDLPTEDPGAGASKYADAVVASLRELADGDVVVVGHSLGGLAVPLIAQRRPVAALVFICAAVPIPGTSLADVIAQDTGADADLLDADVGRHLTARETARETFFHGLPRDVQDWALDRQRAQCERPHREVTPLHAWPDMPVALVNGTRDRCISLGRARRTTQRIFGVGPVEIEDGHFPFLTNPAGVADQLHEIANGESGRWPLVRPLHRSGTADRA